jgi:5-methylcytosine-specific restriction endonuclease McrA
VTTTRYSGPNADQVRRETGRKAGTCTLCGKPAGPGRRYWCSQRCVDEFSIRRSGTRLRAAVYDRDHGVCARCGLDTDGMRKALELHRFDAASRHRQRVVAAAGFSDWRSWWDADHIVPVVEGGGSCGLENVRTLCVPCHRAVTAELAARRAGPRTQQRRALAAAQATLPMEEPITR